MPSFADRCRRRCWPLVAAVLALVVCLPAGAGAQTAKARYEAALAREPLVRRLIESTSPKATAANRNRAIGEAEKLMAAYEQVPRRYPGSAYSDNALWQAAALAETLYKRYERATHRETALKYYRWLVKEYPTSSLVRRARAPIAALEAPPKRAAAKPAPARPMPAPFPTPSRATAAPPAPNDSPAAAAQAPAETMPLATASAAERADLPLPPPPAPDPPASGGTGAAAVADAPAPVATTATATPAESGAAVRLTAIDRALLPGAVRVTLTLDREVPYREERLVDPDRLFFDLAGVELADDLRDRTLRYGSDVVREIRTGRHPEYARVVLDVDGVHTHSVFTLYNPFRLVIEAERTDAAAAAATARALPSTSTRPGTTPAVEAMPTTAAEGAAPDAPATGGDGKYSIARQLGLGISRIVIDPGHGGRDPGARAHGVEEAELVLDVSLRLEKLLKQEPGLEVVLTRRTDVFVPLQERTAIANRVGADLFLSIHANAARNAQARGIETYYLSFASNPEAEAVAARENAASETAMHNLPDIVRAIALNNKLDESRDLAAMVQESLVTRLRRVNAEVRNLGVKKAPFVVLIGAQMPSVLAEISFLTHRQEAALLKTPAYRQQIAEALHQAILRYRQSLKSTVRTADK